MKEHSLSWQGIGRIVVTILVAIFVWKTVNILILILVSVMFASALYPIVKLLNRKLPTIVSIFLVILLLLVPFIILVVTIIPSFVSEFPGLLRAFDKAVHRSILLPSPIRNFDFTQYAQNIGIYVFQSTTIITGFVTSIFTSVFLTLYFLLDSHSLLALFLSLFPKNKHKKITGLFNEVVEVTGQYIRGNILISFICGVILYLGLSILKVPFALPIAIFSAIFDLLPLVGAIIGMIPAFIIALSISPITALLVLALYLIYQQVEGSFLSPVIYNKALNLSPALSFLSVIIGSSLFGIVGAFLALPVAASIPVFIRYFRAEREPTNKPL